MGRWTRVGLVAIGTIAAAALGPRPAESRSIRVEFGATGVDDDARGSSRLRLRGSSDGSFDVTVKRLQPEAEFEVIVDGVKVGTLLTRGSGKGRLRFRTAPRRDDLLLGFDPRGASVIVRDDHGNDVLSGDIPDDDSQPDAGACCDPDVEDDGSIECERRTPDECAARGGTFLAGTSCLPTPCGGPPAPIDVVCCIPDDTGPECEDRTEAECLAQGGMVVGATSCDPNPCAPTPEPEDIQCCLPDDSGVVCEDRTPAECLAQGGVDMGPGTCTLSPCS